MYKVKSVIEFKCTTSNMYKVKSVMQV